MDIVVPAWMLDPPSAQRWRLGRRARLLSALAELQQLLIEHGFGRSFVSHLTIVQEAQDGTLVVTPTLPLPVSRQLIIPFESGRLRGAAPRTEGQLSFD